MADNLHIFKATTGAPNHQPSNQISETVFPATMPNPDFIQGSGVTGFVDEDRLYIGNNGSTHQYDDIVLTPVNDLVTADIQYAKDTAPTSVNGTAGTYANSISYPATYPFGVAAIVPRSGGAASHFVDTLRSLPFFRKLTVTAGQPATRIKNMRHDLDSKEHAL